jgi:hypothetical protein
MFRNDYANGVFKFTELGYVNGAATCTEGYGVGQYDLGVVFADVSKLPTCMDTSTILGLVNGRW